MTLFAPMINSCMGFCMGKKKIREIIEISRISIGFCGAEGVRTLVQL